VFEKKEISGALEQADAVTNVKQKHYLIYVLKQISETICNVQKQQEPSCITAKMNKLLLQNKTDILNV
jgi:hypothetical protein